MLVHLPQNNPVNRELNGPWEDLHYLLHDISSGIRSGNTSFYNANRPKGQAAMKAELLPTPEERTAEREKKTDARSVEQIVAEREHLTKVLARTRAKKALTS